MKNKEQNLPVKTEYLCPLCSAPLYRQWGNQMYSDKVHGVMLFCRNGDPNGRTHPQEVSGHGNSRANADDSVMVKNAYNIILARFKGEKLPAGEAEDNEVETPEPVEVKPAKESKQRKVKGLRVVEAEPEPQAVPQLEEDLI